VESASSEGKYAYYEQPPSRVTQPASFYATPGQLANAKSTNTKYHATHVVIRLTLRAELTSRDAWSLAALSPDVYDSSR
jgi:hypothetical protein